MEPKWLRRFHICRQHQVAGRRDRVSAAKPPFSPTCSTGPHERSEPAHHLRASLVNIVATKPWRAGYAARRRRRGSERRAFARWDVRSVRRRAGLLGVWPWARSLIHSPDAVIHSPAETMAAWPTTVTRSRWPRAFARRTQSRSRRCGRLPAPQGRRVLPELMVQDWTRFGLGAAC